MKRKIIYIVMFMLLISGCKKKQELICEQGSLVDEVCEVTEIVDASILCPAGYTFNQEKGKCVNSMTIAAKTVNKCAKGYVIGNEKWCISEKKYDLIITNTCESDNIKEGDTLSSTYVSEDGLCYEKICTEKSADGKECLKYEEKNIKFKTKRKCPQSGMSIWEGVCRKVSWMNITTSCEVGELVKDKCVIETLSDASISCEEGYSLTEDYKCSKTYYEQAILK